MNKFNKHKAKKLIVLFALFFSLIFINFGPMLTIDWAHNKNLDKTRVIEEINKMEDLPMTSQSLNYSGSGKLIDVTLHQSIKDTTTKQFSNLDVSNSFSEPFPKFLGYNSSFVNVTVDNIHAPNKVITVETGTSTSEPIDTYDWAFSFRVLGNGTLNNFTMCFTENHPFVVDATIGVYLYNAIWDSTEKEMKPSSLLSTLFGAFQIDDGSTAVWYNFTNIDENLDITETNNNTFFILIAQNTPSTQASVRFHYETDGASDDSLAWKDWGSGTWALNNWDPSMKIYLSPLNNTPLPSQVNLKMNNTKVSDITQGSGFWNPSDSFTSNSNELEFRITADWWEVSCDVSNVQINYTKSDIKATSEFRILSSGNEVQWNVTKIGGLNYFDARIMDFNTINFTIPRVWNPSTIKVFNDTDEILSTDINPFLKSNGYREIQVLNAGNGTFWHLTANSTNLLSSIDSYINDILISSSNIANFSSEIKFNANFSEIVSDGIVNLSIYSPITRNMNHTIIYDVFSGAPGKEITIDNWDVSQDIWDYGIFLLLMSWNNDTTAGFIEGYLTIFADTEIKTTLPRTTFDASDEFDIEVYFNDTGLIEGIDGGILNYSINGNPIRGDNIDYSRATNGYYNISIDCNDTQFVNYGDNIITVNISQPFYNNQTDSVTIRINGETIAAITSPSTGSTYNSSEIINLTLSYNNTVRKAGIDGAIINYSLNNGLSYRSGYIDNLDGTYDITFNANDPDFNGYGVKTIIVNASKQYYHNQSESISITIIGETSINVTKIPDRASYNASETVIISLYFNDTVKDLPIDGATVSYQIESGSIRTDFTTLGDGYYNITIYCNDPDFNDYGDKIITVNASKPFYYNQSEVINLHITGETELTYDKIPDKAAYNASESLIIRLYFNDIVEDVPIIGATISYQIESGDFKTDFTTLGDGFYNITIDCNDTDFGGYGWKIITVRANKEDYHNQTRIVSVLIWGESSLSITPDPNRYSFNASETFDLNLYFTDTVKNIPIDGATVSYRIGSGDLRSDFTPLGNGYYTITIDCNDTDFNFYGEKSIFVFINLTHYYNQSQTVNIVIFGVTDLSFNKIPDQPYYDSSETLVLSLYFFDEWKNLPIDGATVSYRIGSGDLRSDFTPLGNGYYNISIDCNDTDFNGYGWKVITVNVSKMYYNNQSTPVNLLIVGFTVLKILDPNNLTAYYSGQIFNITIEFYDTIKNTGITDATISYLLPTSASLRFDNIEHIANGIYRIEIFVNDTDFNDFGYVDISIFSNCTYFLNRSTIFTFHRQITTLITPDPPGNEIPLGSVLCGLNVTYTFNYSDTDGLAVLGAECVLIAPGYNFLYYLREEGNGNYTLMIDTTFVDVSGSPFTLNFNISAFGKQPQILQITIDVLIIYTEIVNPVWDDVIVRNLGLNQTFSFYFNDTVSGIPISNLTSSNIVVRNEGTGSIWDTGDFNWELINPLDDGNYILHISLNGLDSGWYYLSVNVSKFPNYDVSIYYFNFYLKGNETDIIIDYIEEFDGGGILTPIVNNYSIFIGRNLYVNFTILDLDSLQLVTGTDTLILIQYYEIGNLSNNGTLTHGITYDANTYSYRGLIYTSSFSLTSNYIINITINKINYENTTHSINLRIKEKFITEITVLLCPSEVTAGDSFTIHFQVSYLNGSIWMPLIDTTISLTLYFDGVEFSRLTETTNSTGGVSFEIITRSTATDISLYVELEEEYYYTSFEDTITGIELIPLPPGFSFEDLLPYILIIGVLVGAVAISLGAYRGVVVPRKREKNRILNEVKTIFDDAINLEHILVLYKGTGTCIFFKSYGSEEIDPELIGGFLTAVSSFGKEMVAQEALNEISYGDKMLLLADGEYIRVALVLSKKASLILRNHLRAFIEAFERTYNDILPKWRGQLNHFKNAGALVDELLNTSIILPHQISYKFSDIKDLKIPHSKEVLKVAHSCCEEADREFFFIATLLREAAETTNKDTAEIFMGIKELRDKRVLIPIEISAIETQPISQQELNLINQKVSQISNLSDAEKQKLVNDLSQMGPAEREAYLTSLTERQAIISAPIQSKVGDTVIEDKKTAYKEIKSLTSSAKKFIMKKDYEESLETLRKAAVIASSWDLSKEFNNLQEYIRKTTIEELLQKKKLAESEANNFEKEKNYHEAAKKYKEASKIASEIFKLGINSMMKEVKKLTNKSNELEKLR